MADALPTYQAHQAYLDVDLTETETNNQCGRTLVADSGSRKITIIQGVSQHAFATHFANIINRQVSQ